MGAKEGHGGPEIREHSVPVCKEEEEGKCEFKFKRAERNVQTETQSRRQIRLTHTDARHSQVPMSPLVL